MAIPDFQTLMLPFLILANRKEPANINVYIEELARLYNLTDSEMIEKLDSGQYRFANRVAWAKSYLSKAELVEIPQRGLVIISSKGIKVLDSNPERINVRFLKQLVPFSVLPGTAKRKDVKYAKHEDVTFDTPEEVIEKAYKDIRENLAKDLLSQVLRLTPDQFEKLVVELLVKMGYGGSIKDAGEAIGRSGDEGIDGIIKEDILGLDKIYLQAKRWKPNLGQ